METVPVSAAWLPLQFLLATQLHLIKLHLIMSLFVVASLLPQALYVVCERADSSLKSYLNLKGLNIPCGCITNSIWHQAATDSTDEQ